MALKIPVSFAADEVYLYDYVKSKRNYSAYIKDLVEEDMKRNGINNKKPEINSVTRNENDFGLDF